MALCWAPTAALVSGLACVQLGLLAGSAQAQVVGEPDVRARPLVLDSERCSSVPRNELRELVTLELAPRRVVATTEVTDSESTMRAELTCSETRASLFVRDAARQQQQELGLDLTQIAPPARARLIALALAELIATVDMEPLAPMPAQPGKTPTPAPASAQGSAKNDDLRGAPGSTQNNSAQNNSAQNSWWLSAGIVREGRPRMLAPSLQSGVIATLTKLPLALHSELQLQRGQRAVSAGQVTAWTVSGSLGFAGLLRAGRSELALGLGGRLGYARLVGQAESANTALSAHTVSGLWWGPTMLASVVLPLRERWGLRAGVDLTWVVRGVRGLDSDGVAAFKLEGLMMHATLGVSLDFKTRRRTPIATR